MGFFKTLFGPSKTEEELANDRRAEIQDIWPKIVATYSAATTGERDAVIQALADKYNKTPRGIRVILMRAGAYKPRLNAPGKMAALAAHLASLGKFTASRHAIAVDGETGVAFDEGKSKLCLLFHDVESPSHRLISPRDLYSVEVVEEDGASKTRVTQSTKLGSAIVGGLLLGGVGAVVGGLAGKSGSETSRVVTRLTLRLTVNSTSAPTHNIILINQPLETSSDAFKTARATASEWSDLLAVLIKRAQSDSETPKTTRPKSRSPSPAKSSIADELKKLLELQQCGALSAEEFSACKAKLLSSTDRNSES